MLFFVPIYLMYYSWFPEIYSSNRIFLLGVNVMLLLVDIC